MEEIAIVIVVVGLVLFFLYLVLVKKKKPEEALEEVVDYAVEHKDELLKLTETDLLAMESEEIEDMCEKLGLPAVGGKADLAANILKHVKEHLG